ncbi:DUF4350 domain-containing protein [Marinigracilibium pacificum]|uniref:DUF4350 domain-containing protein n=1 Tax=Marinigracilibium pacificum TaxID=2729599 RepID=A0A848J1J5_9BACT|nr:DUF4350 domain-containing protein [Marinigracilibium pacificum]NMM48179.1 hypothetical protein [Marinigracilibium pacificum]
MRDNLVNIIIVVLVSLVIFLIGFSLLNTRYHWNETYSWEGENPYDLKLYNEWLTTLNDHNVEYLNLKNAEKSFNDSSAYLIIGNSIAESNKQLPKLFNAVNNGATAMIATYENPYDILDSLESHFDNEIYYYSSESLKRYEIYNNNLSEIFVRYDNYGDPQFTSDLRLLEDYDTDYVDPLLFIESSPIAFSVQFGEGRFIFVSTPLIFTNYYLSQKKYKSVKFLTEELDGKTLYLDRYFTNLFKNEDYSDDTGLNASPLSFVLSNNQLSAAWYLFLVTALIYLLYVSKRKQRIIPVIPQKENRTLSHIQLVGELYFQKADSYLIYKKLNKVFLEHIRSKYNLNTSNLDEKFKEKLSMKSGVDKNLVNSIFDFINKFDYKKSVSDDDLMRLYNLIHTFYNKEL